MSLADVCWRGAMMMPSGSLRYPNLHQIGAVIQHNILWSHHRARTYFAVVFAFQPRIAGTLAKSGMDGQAGIILQKFYVLIFCGGW